MKNLVLAIVAILLFIILEPISFIYVNFFKQKFNWQRLFGYWRGFAIAVDRFGNYQFRSLFNRFLIEKDAYQFGDFRETISSVLGKNERDNTLTKTGIFLTRILNKLDKNHCQNSIMIFVENQL